MKRALREALVQVWEYLSAWGPFLLVAVAALALAYAVLKPAPPGHVTIAVGSEKSAYAEFARRYAAELARNRNRVALPTTTGS